MEGVGGGGACARARVCVCALPFTVLLNPSLRGPLGLNPQGTFGGNLWRSPTPGRWEAGVGVAFPPNLSPEVEGHLGALSRHTSFALLAA